MSTSRAVPRLASLAGSALFGLLLAAPAVPARTAPAAGTEEAQVLSLSPQDTVLNLDDANYSTDTSLGTYTWPDNQVANAILMRFDLQALPAGAVVEKATLHLALVDSDASPDGAYTVTAHKVLGRAPVVARATGYSTDGVSAWTSNACCSGDVPLAQADLSPAYDARAIDKAPGYKAWTITRMVQEWRADPATNFGLLLNADVSRLRDRYRYFASAEHPDPALRPFLRIAYSLPSRLLALTPQDTFLGINSSNYAAATRLGTYTWPNRRVANAILMRFDLAGLPAGAEVQEATLHLALTESDARAEATYAVTAHKVVGRSPVISRATGYTSDGVTAWTPNPCCSNGVPMAQADISPPYDTRAVDKALGPKVWTITQMVREWLAQPGTNSGLLLNADASKLRDRYRMFASMEHPDPALRPVLRIAYTTPDATPPSVSLTSPSGGAAVAGTVAVAASASDDVGVAGVRFELDGAALGAEDTTAPYSVSWSTTAAANGSHVLTAVARDAAGHVATSAGVTVTVSNAPPPSTGGIAALYPGDAGIEGHPDVVFVEKFEQGTLADLFARWSDVLGSAVLSFKADVPPGSPGSRSLDIPWTGGGVTDGGHLYKQLGAPVDDTLYVRYYVKYPAGGGYTHSGVWMGGNNPASAWPNPQAGVKPTGSDRFIAAAEQNPPRARFDHYDYWMGMRQSADGNYWGNLLLDDPDVQAGAGRWTCVEHMVKLNHPTTAANGEHAIWLDGVKVSHLGQGFPKGRWSGGIFTQDPTGSPFEGFRWRSDANLKLNWIWLQVYAPGSPAGFSSSVKFDHVVAARSYVGCLAPGSPDATPPTVSISSPAAAAKVSGPVTVSASASDNVGVAGVRFKLDGLDLGSEDATAPYSVSWDTTGVPSGSHVLTAVARDAAGNLATSAPRSVTVSNASGGEVVFESNWDTATGTAGSAVNDGGRWPNYWEFNNGSGVQLLSVVGGGVNGHNALRVQQRGSSYAANVQLDDFLPPSTDYYLRYYMKNDDTSSAGDHVVTVDTYNYSNLTFMRKYGSGSSWRFVVSLYGCGFTYPIGHWGPTQTLANGQWYRFEYHVDYVGASRVQVHPRVYDAAGNLVLSDADFRQEDYGSASWNGRSDWTLASYYAAGYSFCVDPAWMNDLGLGNNGQYGAGDTGRYWYFSAVQVRTDRWPGAAAGVP